MVESYLDYLQRSMDQRKRAGAIKTSDPVSQAKREYLLKMAERNETQAEVTMRKNAKNPVGPAVRALATIDKELVELREKLSKLGINIRPKK